MKKNENHSSENSILTVENDPSPIVFPKMKSLAHFLDGGGFASLTALPSIPSPGGDGGSVL